MKHFITLGAALIAVASVQAQENPQEIFLAANLAYDQKDYPAAIEKYQNLLQQGQATTAVYYNLGNCYFRLGDLGRAIWSYRRALKLNPGDKDTRENLEFARLYRIDKIKEENSFAPLSIFYFLPTTLGLNSVSWLGALLWWTSAGFLLLLLVFRRRTRLIQILTGISLALLLILAISLWVGIKAEGKKYAVVLSNEAEAKSGPGEDYVSLFNVHQGLECEVEEEREGWYLIYLSNGTKGWVPGRTLGLI